MTVPGTHPRLAAALDAMNAGTEGWPAEMIAIGLGARLARDEGRRCECAAPILTGDDLMCGRCLLENRSQELRKLDVMFGPHDFVLSTRKSGAWMGWCEICTYPADDPRHHGQAKPCRTSWGEDYTPKERP